MTDSARHKLGFVFGTRPEAIKMAPVIAGAEASADFEVLNILTGQHREMLDQVASLFGIRAVHDLDVMTPGQDLASLTARLCESLGRVLRQDRPDCVVVQGDTTSCFVGALAAFYEGIPVAHLEAGLRTSDPAQPFPEEMNRRLVGSLARYHFAPTAVARANLLGERVPEERIWVVGNTGVDALRLISERARVVPDSPLAAALAAADEAGGPVLTVTTHRRENRPFMTEIASAIADLLGMVEGLHVVFPVHLSPAVRDVVYRVLSSADRCHLLEPLSYDQFVCLMRRSDVLLTDSGGIQEEAAYLGKPTLVMRRKTERPEAIEAGNAKLVGEGRGSICEATGGLLTDEDARRAMCGRSEPYGDGHTAERVLAILGAQLGDGGDDGR